MVLALEYNYGINENSEFIVEIKTLDVDGFIDVFGTYENNETVGDKHKIEIDSVYEENIAGADGWTVNSSKWNWIKANEEFGEEPDKKDLKSWMPKNTSFLGFVEIWIFEWVPIPVIDYLSHIQWGSNIAIYNTIVTININKSSVYGLALGLAKDLIQIFEYDAETGYLISLIYKNQNGEIIYEESLINVDNLNFLFILILIISTIGCIAIIIIILRKKGIILNKDLKKSNSLKEKPILRPKKAPLQINKKVKPLITTPTRVLSPEIKKNIQDLEDQITSIEILIQKRDIKFNAGVISEEEYFREKDSLSKKINKLNLMKK